MGLFIVSKQVLLRELVISYCRDEGIEIDGAAARLPQVHPTTRNPIVVLHATGHNDVKIGEIEAFRARLPKARIVLICARNICDALDPDILHQVEATVLEDSSLKSLSGVLALVREGFVITPASETGPAPTPLQEPGPPPADPAVSGESHSTPAASRTVSDRAASDRRDDRQAPPLSADAIATSVARHNQLSAREEAVIRKLCEGASNKDIAKALRIGESTVKVHLRACYRKIGVRNRTQAAIWAANELAQRDPSK